MLRGYNIFSYRLQTCVYVCVHVCMNGCMCECVCVHACVCDSQMTVTNADSHDSPKKVQIPPSLVIKHPLHVPLKYQRQAVKLKLPTKFKIYKHKCYNMKSPKVLNLWLNVPKTMNEYVTI